MMLCFEQNLNALQLSGYKLYQQNITNKTKKEIKSTKLNFITGSTAWTADFHPT